MRVAAVCAFMLASGAPFALEAAAQGALADRVKACAAVKDAAARLTCFDAAASELQSPAVAGQSVERKVVKAPAPAAAAPATASIVPTQTPDRMSVGVTAIAAGADGKLRFSLSNGETWRQTDSTALKNLGKGPWEAELRKAAMGSYMLRMGNKAAVRVTQVK